MNAKQYGRQLNRWYIDIDSDINRLKPMYFLSKLINNQWFE